MRDAFIKWTQRTFLFEKIAEKTVVIMSYMMNDQRFPYRPNERETTFKNVELIRLIGKQYRLNFNISMDFN